MLGRAFSGGQGERGGDGRAFTEVFSDSLELGNKSHTFVLDLIFFFFEELSYRRVLSDGGKYMVDK